LALTGLSVGCLLGCGDRPQQVGAPVEAYLDGLQEPEIRAVRMCWEGCEESESVAPDRWAGLLEAIERTTRSDEPLSALTSWRWICRVNIDTETANWLDIAVQEATLGGERGTYAILLGGGVGQDYSLFDGAPVANWCHAVKASDSK
jgi:hypothetical protein